VAVNFVSFEFEAFLAVVYVLHWSCHHASIRKWLLVIASYIFYAVWDWHFCFLMLFVTVNAFAVGQRQCHGNDEGASLWGKLPVWISSPTDGTASRRRSSSTRSGFISGSH
jgi:hypothetical protein